MMMPIGPGEWMLFNRYKINAMTFCDSCRIIHIQLVCCNGDRDFLFIIMLIVMIAS